MDTGMSTRATGPENLRAAGRLSPFYADTACASTTAHRITWPKLGATRCSNSDPRNDHNELFAVTGAVARQYTPHRSQPPTTGRMPHRRKHGGSASGAGQLLHQSC